MMIDDRSYRAALDGDQRGMSAYYNRTGKLTATGKMIPIQELPPSVSKYVSDNNNGITISSVSKVTNTSGNVWYSEGVDNKYMKFDSKGSPIRK